MKQKIINTASKLFYEKGYNSTGINEIIKSAGIAKATLYHHFASKTDICKAYLIQQQEKFIDKWDNELSKTDNPQEKLTCIFEVVWELYRQKKFHGDWGVKIYSEVGTSEISVTQLIQTHKREILTRLESLAEQYLMPISKAECERLSGTIYMLFESAMTESYLHQNDWPIYLSKNIVISQIRSLKGI